MVVVGAGAAGVVVVVMKEVLVVVKEVLVVVKEALVVVKEVLVGAWVVDDVTLPAGAATARTQLLCWQTRGGAHAPQSTSARPKRVYTPHSM